jgi:hypothetical protein
VLLGKMELMTVSDRIKNGSWEENPRHNIFGWVNLYMMVIDEY